MEAIGFVDHTGVVDVEYFAGSANSGGKATASGELVDTESVMTISDVKMEAFDQNAVLADSDSFIGCHIPDSKIMVADQIQDTQSKAI